MKKKLRKLVPRRRRRHQEIVPEPTLDSNVPRITNDTVAAHREEVLSSARKYIYPLQHSKHKIVLITTGLFIAAVVAFFSYCTIALYRLKDNSSFLYGVTQVIPFPIAKAGPDFVAYENYLFELRHYLHYYQTQQKLDFNSDFGKAQLSNYKKQALEKVINDAYIKQLAAKNHVSVSNQELNDQIQILRDQNRLGGSNKVFEDVLKDYWGWTVNDFKRSLREQLLAQKLVATLDTDTQNRAKAALSELQGGADFAATAKKYSDDTATKDNGGDLGIIDPTNRDLPAQTVAALNKLGPGQTSAIINVGYGLEIVKVIDKPGNQIHAAHIAFNFKDINTYLNDIKDKDKTRTFVKL